jgi:DNA-binding MarR family transcriptional regulator
MGDKKAIADLVAQVAGECLAVRVRSINRAITGIYDEAMRRYGVRISQLNILVAVARLGEARPADVCRVLRIEKSTLSRDVELMKNKGWLASDPPRGGRNQVLRLAPSGRELLERVHPAWERAQAEARSLIGDEGVAVLHDVASRMGLGPPQGR